MDRFTLVVGIMDAKLAEEKCDSLYGKNNRRYAESLHRMAKNYGSLGSGNHSACLDLNYQALKIRRDIFGEHHIDVARSLMNIAVEFNNQNINDSLVMNWEELFFVCKKNQKPTPPPPPQ